MEFLKSLLSVSNTFSVKNITWILIISIITSITEIMLISSLIPLVGMMTESSVVMNNEYYLFVNNYIGIEGENELLVWLVTCFSIFAIISAIIRIYSSYVITEFSHTVGYEISHSIFKSIFTTNYLDLKRKGSEEYISAITAKTNSVVYDVIYPILQIVSSIIIMLAIVSAMLFVDFNATITILGVVGSFYIIIAKRVRKKINYNSQRIAELSERVVADVQESIENLVMIKTTGSYTKFSADFLNHEMCLRRSQSSSIVLGQIPRYLIEAFGLIVISISLMFRSESDGYVIATLAGLVMGAQRILPLAQQIYHSWSRIVVSRRSIHDINDMLKNMDLENEEKIIKFKVIDINKIELKNIGFTYNQDASAVFSKLNLQASRGELIGIIGKSGSGKSTLLNIIIGLYKPSDGCIIIN